MLKSGEIVAVRDMEKAEMLAKAFVKVHSSNNLTEEGEGGSEKNIWGSWIRERLWGKHWMPLLRWLRGREH